MCTLDKRGRLFILTLIGDSKHDQEHRLSPPLISSIRSTLAEVRSQSTVGSVLLTRSEGRFFSNGFDLRHAQAVGLAAGSAEAAQTELFRMVELFRGVVSDLLSLPMPTIAAVTGHASAAGMIFAMSHDYVTMSSAPSPRPPVMYMSELDIGMTLPDYFTALIRSKIGSAAARRDVTLGAKKISADAAMTMGIVDSVHGSAEETTAVAERRAEELGRRGWNGEVYSEIRKSLYPDVCGILGLAEKTLVFAKL